MKLHQLNQHKDGKYTIITASTGQRKDMGNSFALPKKTSRVTKEVQQEN